MAKEAGHALRRLALALLLALVAGAVAAEPRVRRPAWAELTADQQHVLEPLKAEWDRMTVEQRRHWIGIANRYPKLGEREQARVRERMTAWAKLSPQERRLARERYKNIGKLPPEKRQELVEQWAQYQALSPIERRMLDAPAVEDVRERGRRRSKAPAAGGSVRPTPLP